VRPKYTSLRHQWSRVPPQKIIIIHLVNFQRFTPQDQFPAHNITSPDPILCQWNSAPQPRSLLI